MLSEATESAQPKPAATAPPLGIVAQDMVRMDAYEQFRNFYELERFVEALPYAKQVVKLSESDSDRDYQLPIAYNNLGATQYQLADYPGAEASYRSSLELLESTQGISSRRLVIPLAGLGAVYAAQGQHAIAAELFDRALAVSRRSDGLFNLQQLPLIEQAADSRYAISDYQGAERARLYALRVAEQNYGYGDPRTLPLLLELGSFYESLREFIAARNIYMRARDTSLKPGIYEPNAVRALCGIARTYRLQYTMNPDSLESQTSDRDEVTGAMIGSHIRKDSAASPSAADRTGLKAAQTALDLLRSTQNPPADLMTQALMELGDWHQATLKPEIAMPYYAEAAAIFDAMSAKDPLAGHPLKAPRMVFYRPPLSARRAFNIPPDQYVIRKTVFSFAVSEAGLPLDIAVVSTDMEEGQLSQSRRALSKAIYSPRFTGGQPVSTAGVTFTSEWYQEHDPNSAPANATPISTPAAEAEAGPEAEPDKKPASGSGA
jgi:tetratricopeptide (TPR) repeat protein